MVEYLQLTGCNLDLSKNEIIVENQRGLTVLGYPLFSANLLLPTLDPPQFQLLCKQEVKEIALHKTSGNVADITYTLNKLSHQVSSSFEHLYPLAFDECYSDNKWYVYMSLADADDQGWCYSWNFHNRRWKSKNGFVRKRIWIKLKNLN